MRLSSRQGVGALAVSCVLRGAYFVRLRVGVFVSNTDMDLGQSKIDESSVSEATKRIECGTSGLET